MHDATLMDLKIEKGAGIGPDQPGCCGVTTACGILDASPNSRGSKTMQSTTTRTQQIIEQIKTLPTDSLNDLATYIDFPRFRASKTEDTE